MSKRDLSEISNHLKYEFLEAGDTIFKQGDPGDQFYIIMKGQVQVSIAEKKQESVKSKQQTFVTEIQTNVQTKKAFDINDLSPNAL